MHRKLTACVTGASGTVGNKIVNRLIENGYHVKGLSRNGIQCHPEIDLFIGSLEDKKVLESFLLDADILFHCAAELNDPETMWSVNVAGTQLLVDLIGETPIKYFCYLSSTGVFGNTDAKWVDEDTACNPQNLYEQTKLEAEKIVIKNTQGIRTIILRPTNVIDENKLGVFETIINRSLINYLKIMIKGGECAHAIYSENVAAAATYFISHPFSSPHCFIVSDDHDPNNTFSGLSALYRNIKKKQSKDILKNPVHLPIIIPYLFRTFLKRRTNKGDIKYSSQKLLEEGFEFPLDLTDSIRRIASNQPPE